MRCSAVYVVLFAFRFTRLKTTAGTFWLTCVVVLVDWVFIVYRTVLCVLSLEIQRTRYSSVTVYFVLLVDGSYAVVSVYCCGSAQPDLCMWLVYRAAY